MNTYHNLQLEVVQIEEVFANRGMLREEAYEALLHVLRQGMSDLEGVSQTSLKRLTNLVLDAAERIECS